MRKRLANAAQAGKYRGKYAGKFFLRCQALSGDVRRVMRCQAMSGALCDVRRCQAVSGDVRRVMRCQAMSGTLCAVRRCQARYAMSGAVRRCQAMSGALRTKKPRMIARRGFGVKKAALGGLIGFHKVKCNVTRTASPASFIMRSIVSASISSPLFRAPSAVLKDLLFLICARKRTAY